MSRTDNTVPWRLRHQHGIPEWRSYGWGGHSSSIKHYVRWHTRRARHRARAALRRGLEPEPYRPRSSAKWDAW
jgi:hypothetical protein